MSKKYDNLIALKSMDKLLVGLWIGKKHGIPKPLYYKLEKTISDLLYSVNMAFDPPLRITPDEIDKLDKVELRD